MTQEIQHDRQILVMAPTPGGPISREKLRSVINHPLQENTEFGRPGGVDGILTPKMQNTSWIAMEISKRMRIAKRLPSSISNFLPMEKGWLFQNLYGAVYRTAECRNLIFLPKFLLVAGKMVQPLPPT